MSETSSSDSSIPDSTDSSASDSEMYDSTVSDNESSDSDTSDAVGNDFSFTWKIDNYSFCYRKTGEFIKSPVFTAENFGSSMWFMRLYPRSKYLTDKKHISLYLGRCINDRFRKAVNARVKFEIIDGNDKKLYSKNSKCHKFANGTVWGYSTIRLTQKITDPSLYWEKDILTIRCALNIENRQQKCKAHSKIIVDHCSFRLEVPLNDFYNYTQCEKFSFSETSIYEMTVVIKEGLAKIEIHQQKENSFSLQYISGEISLINVSGNILLSHRSTHIFEQSNDSKIWEFPPFFIKQDIEENLKGSFFILLFQFSASNGMHSTYQKNSSNLLNLLVLQDDLGSMLKKQKHCDIQLQVEDVAFPAHKCLLASRSSVFTAMFNQDMNETHSGIVNISDVDVDTMRSFLEFMYTGKVGMKNSGCVSKLIMMADKYQVESLKEKCSNYLQLVLSVENACEVLVVADLISHKSLKSIALDFIAMHMTVVSSSSDWLEWIAKNNRLLNEIILHISGDFKISRKH